MPMPDHPRADENPLALAVLVLLFERPMHPYEMAATLRERRKEASIRIHYGSLYPMIRRLLRKKLVVVRQSARDGKRPAKTVYELTPGGEAKMTAWMRELVSSPVKEFPMFEAAMSLLPALPPDEAIDLLGRRVGGLEKIFKELDEEERKCREMGLPRLFSLESEYYRSMVRAEYEFCQGLLADLRHDADALKSTWTKVRKEILAAKSGAGKQRSKSRGGAAPAVQGWSKKHWEQMAKYWIPKGPGH